MWSPLELIGKTCTAALTQPVCNPRSAMQCNGLNCMYVHLQWFTVWNKLGRPALLNLTFFETLNISTSHKWTNGYVIQMQMQKLQILTLAIPRANKGNASTWRGHILSAERKRLHLLFQLQRGHSAAMRCSVPYSFCTITACLHIFNDFRNTITCNDSSALKFPDWVGYKI